MTKARTQATEPIDSEQATVHKEKRARLLTTGFGPYSVDLVRSHTLLQVREGWGHLEVGEETDDVVQVGGRVVFIRNTGKLAFATLQDGLTPDDNGERLQVMLSLAEVGAEILAAWKSDIDLGDHVWVEGCVILSKRGELSVMAKRWWMASKALHPLPVLHKELSEESRVRRHYVDLIAREDAHAMVCDRAAVTHVTRDTLYRQGHMEVETPQLQPVHGGATARSFTTHLDALDIDMSLCITLGLHPECTMADDADCTYEMGRVFRNESIDSSYSAEFTMLEAYQSWGDQRTIAQLIQDAIAAAADAVGSRQVETDRGTIDLDGQWRWLPFFDGLGEAAGREITVETSLEELRVVADGHEVEYDPKWNAGKLSLELSGDLVEPGLIQPTFVYDYPSLARPPARPRRSEPGKIEAWNLIISGMERGTDFTELIDPVIQRDVLVRQPLAAAAGDPEAMQLDEDFLEALEYEAPPMGGLGLGIDRLVMLLNPGTSIRETTLYPLLRPSAG